MENASKALIIAGAILLSILIIGIGMTIYKQAAGVINNTGIDKTEVTTANAEFEKYAGNNVTGANVKALIDLVKSHNRTTDDKSRQITMKEVESGEISTADTYPVDENPTVSGSAALGKTYTVKCFYDSKTGFLTKIEYKVNS